MRRSKKSKLSVKHYGTLLELRKTQEETLKYRTLLLSDCSWQAEIIGPTKSQFYGYTSISYRAESAVQKLSDQLATYGFIGQLKGEK